MNAIVAIFWTCLFIVFYTYLGYALLLFFLLRCRKFFFGNKEEFIQTELPDVALVIAAYDEEDIILAKIRNTLELNYPVEKLRVIFVTDGSTDQTPALISANSSFELMHLPERKGKSAAINRAMQQVTQPVVIFCDANTLLNKDCVLQIVRHYADPKVGGVAGEKKIMEKGGTAVSSGETLYWQYESFVKKMDSAFYSVVGAAGELLSLRTSLYQPVEESVVIEDFVISLRICLRGYIIKYEPGAYASETSSITIMEEQKRKIRISAGAFQAMWLLRPLLNVFKYPRLSFLYISHRVLRWTVCPLCLLLVLITNSYLFLNTDDVWFGCLLVAQITFYIMAIAGWIAAVLNIKTKILYVPFYFLFMNLSVFAGFYRHITRKQTVLWQKAAREKLA